MDEETLRRQTIQCVVYVGNMSKKKRKDLFSYMKSLGYQANHNGDIVYGYYVAVSGGYILGYADKLAYVYWRRYEDCGNDIEKFKEKIK